MAKYIKRPIVVEAEQYIAEHREPKGLCWELGHGVNCPHVHTIHLNEMGSFQAVEIQNGDWVIGEPDGVHSYPCKNDIFQATYEIVSKEWRKEAGLPYKESDS